MEDAALKAFIKSIVEAQGDAIATRLEASMVAVADRAANKALGSWGQVVGYDLSDPKDVQRMQGDFSSMRRMHDRERAVGGWIGKAVVLAVMGVFIAAAGIGLKMMAAAGAIVPTSISPPGPFR